MKKNINTFNLKSFENLSFTNLQNIYGGIGDTNDNDDTDRGTLKVPTQGASEGDN